LLEKDYSQVLEKFERDFYQVTRGIKVFDLVKFINNTGLNYTNRFFNHNDYNKEEAVRFSMIPNSITLIRKNEKYPVGHYLLRIEGGWVDPWVNYPSINIVHAGVVAELPGEPWYVAYPNDAGAL
jgi:hypothetical protein